MRFPIKRPIKDKDSREARYDKELGNHDEDVIVKDCFTNGEKITFIWNKGKSNDNIDDTDEGKGGFSFYEARYVYRDPYKQKDIVKASNPDGCSIAGTIFQGDSEVMLVIQERIEGKDEEGDPKIRILSATYASDNVQLAYFRRAFQMAKKNGGELERLGETTGNDDFIALTTREHRKLPENDPKGIIA